MTDSDAPLDADDLLTLTIWADLVGRKARCSAGTLRRALATIREQKRHIRRLEATVAEMMTQPNTPPGTTK